MESVASGLRILKAVSNDLTKGHPAVVVEATRTGWYVAAAVKPPRKTDRSISSESESLEVAVERVLQGARRIRAEAKRG